MTLFKFLVRFLIKGLIKGELYPPDEHSFFIILFHR